MRPVNPVRFVDKGGRPRECGYVIDDATNEPCGLPAAIHVFWDTRLRHSFFCKDHRAEALMYERYAYHTIQPLCGMPGTKYDPRSNTCKLDEQGLPVAEKAGKELAAR